MDFKKLFQKKDVRAHFAKEDSVYIRNPHISWVLMLKIFALLLLIVFGLSGYKFYITDKRAVEVIIDEESGTKDAIQVEKLDAILDSFDAKKKRTIEYKTTPPVFVDPSR